MINRDLINSIEFKGLENIKCGDVLYFLFETMKEEDLLSKASIYSFYRIIRSSFFDRIQIESVEKPAVAFVFTNSYRNRMDYMDWFNNVIALCENKLVFKPKKYRFNLSNVVKIKYYYKWLKQCIEKKINKREARLLCSVLYDCYIDYNLIIDRIIKSSVKLAVVLCDTHTIDNMIVSACNRLNIDTATLQHGSVSAGWGLKNSNSKYFLSHGKFTEEQCLASGMHKNKILNIGNPKFIDEVLTDELLINNHKKIGIIFCGGKYYEDDIKMLEITLKYAKKNKYSIYVKLHPGFEKERYYYNKWYLVESIYSDDITIKDFAHLVDFSITAGSTAFVEFMIYLYPIFTFDGQYKIYDKIEWCKFSNLSNLEKIIDKYMNNPQLLERKMIETRNYFCECTNIKENYIDFFHKYV